MLDDLLKNPLITRGHHSVAELIHGGHATHDLHQTDSCRVKYFFGRADDA